MSTSLSSHSSAEAGFDGPSTIWFTCLLCQDGATHLCALLPVFYDLRLGLRPLTLINHSYVYAQGSTFNGAQLLCIKVPFLGLT